MERRDFLQQVDCFVCNQQEAGLLFSDDYDHLSPSCEIGNRLAASVISITENVCPRFRPLEFGLDVPVVD